MADHPRKQFRGAASADLKDVQAFLASVGMYQALRWNLSARYKEHANVVGIDRDKANVGIGVSRTNLVPEQRGIAIGNDQRRQLYLDALIAEVKVVANSVIWANGTTKNGVRESLSNSANGARC
jgi:hypothetical protein